MNIGTQREFSVLIDQPMVDAFAALSGDRNPLHVDSAAAADSEFKKRVAHGALLVSHVSRLLGMELPGPRCVIRRMEIRFPRPLLPPATVRVGGLLQAYSDERSDGKVNFWVDSSQGRHAEGSAYFMLHSEPSAAATSNRISTPVPAASARSTSSRSVKKLLMTGGTGGVGSSLVSHLAEHYDCMVLTRQKQASRERTHYVTLNLDSPEELENFLAQENPGGYWGILHLSAPPLNQHLLLDSVEEVRHQLHHAVDIPLQLAQWAGRKDSTIRRLVLMGSTAGSKHLESNWAPYSLAKSCLGSLAQLLAVELARNGITVNVVAPGLVPVGMNAGLPQRKQAALAGLVPSGRLTQPEDVLQVVDFLLSEKTGQINGTTVVVDGGTLS